jgi:hypothetical protein
MFSEPAKTYWYVFGIYGTSIIIQLTFYMFSQLNIMTITLSIMSWFIFYDLYGISGKIKIIFNKK